MIYVGFGFELVSLIAAAAFLGKYLDDLYPSKGLITIALIVAGFIAWITRITLWAKRQEDQDK
jgi:F0F1-type ATP synthase assembly protein I